MFAARLYFPIRKKVTQWNFVLENLHHGQNYNYDNEWMIV